MAKASKMNPRLLRTVQELRDLSREHQAAIWGAVADRLERARRNWSEVNLSRLDRYVSKGDQVVVPGVLLASGRLRIPVTVAAFRASTAAKRKVEAAGGKTMSLLELALANPKGRGVRIMG